jgi:hypothetical protein
MTTVVPVLSSGVAPQNAVISRALISPELVLGDGSYDNDNHFNCPPGVPLFTTKEGLNSMQRPSRSGRDTGRDFIIPVIFNVPSGRNDLIFVGVSYGAATRKQPIVSMATAGLVSIPYHPSGVASPPPMYASGSSFRRSGFPYGSPGGPYIGIITKEGEGSDITSAGNGDITAYTVQRTGPHDVTVLLGTPRQNGIYPRTDPEDAVTNPVDVGEDDQPAA